VTDAVGRKAIAYVDESVDADRYVLAAVTVDADAAAEIREVLRALRLRGQQRLHWHAEASVRRAELASAAAEFGCASIAVVGAPVQLRRQDRARRQCLRRLLWELRQLGVRSIVIESRGPERDRADDAALAAFRRDRTILAITAVQHARPVQEVGLWLPDIVAGAVLADARGDDRYRKAFEQSLRCIPLELA
jgi:hypothetical protein